MKGLIDINKTSQKKAEKNIKLIASALELFEAKGFQAVSIDDIVKKAGVAKGTFYLYFNDKADLVTKLIVKKASEYMSEEIDFPEIDDSLNFSEAVEKYIDLLVGFLESNRTLAVLIDKNVHICVNAVIEHREGAVKNMYDKIYDYFLSKGFSGEEISTKMYLFGELIVSSCCNAVLCSYPYSLEKIKPHLKDIVTMSIYGADIYRKSRKEANVSDD